MANYIYRNAGRLGWLAAITMAATVHAYAQQGNWKDPLDVASPNADIVSGSATVVGDMVDLRIQFNALPFPSWHTHIISWCIDADQNAATGGSCGNGELMGADAGVRVEFILPGQNPSYPEGRMVVSVGQKELDEASVLSVDTATNTLRLHLPLEYIDDDGRFNYIVESAFGSSFGANDRAPDGANFKGMENYFTSSIAETFGDPVSGVDIGTGQDLTMRLEQNDPNPATGNTAIRFSLASATRVQLWVTDAAGGEVATLASGLLDAGDHIVNWNVGAVPSGVYFYVLASEKESRRGRMVVVR